MKRILPLTLALLGSVFFSSAHAEDTPSTEFALTTTAYLDQMTIPVLYTCQGKDLSPQLDWTNTPEKTQTLAVIMYDINAPGGNFYHWIVYNIPKSMTSLPEGLTEAPAGALFGKNSFNKMQYSGPCPPTGAAHTYVITLYALDTKLSLPAGADGKTVLNAMEKHILKKAVLSGVYTPWPPA